MFLQKLSKIDLRPIDLVNILKISTLKCSNNCLVDSIEKNCCCWISLFSRKLWFFKKIYLSWPTDKNNLIKVRLSSKKTCPHLLLRKLPLVRFDFSKPNKILIKTQLNEVKTYIKFYRPLKNIFLSKLNQLLMNFQYTSWQQ